MSYDPLRHHRRSIRLKNFDYSQPGLYFITLVVKNRENIFGDIKHGKMILNDFGLIAQAEWENTALIRKNVTLGSYIVMPNHFHAIIQINYRLKPQEHTPNQFKSPSQTIGAIVRGYKGATTKKIRILHQNIKNNKDLDNAKGVDSKGELQFAPTIAPTIAPTSAPLPNIPSKGSIWQRDYWDIIIRDERSHYYISNYIENNAKKWEKDKLKKKT